MEDFICQESGNNKIGKVYPGLEQRAFSIIRPAKYVWLYVRNTHARQYNLFQLNKYA